MFKEKDEEVEVVVGKLGRDGDRRGKVEVRLIWVCMQPRSCSQA